MRAIIDFAREYFRDFKPLFRLPREFWTIQGINFFHSLMYFSFATIGSVYLSQDVGFSDESAGMLFGLFLAGTAVLQILMGPVLDRVGYRKLPLVSSIIVMFGMMGAGAAPLMFGATFAGQVFMVLCIIIAMVGNGMFLPVLTAGTKRFSNKETRGAAFNMWYLIMNIGAVFLFTLDFLRRPIEDKPTLEQVAVFRDVGGNTHIMWYLAGLCVLVFVINFLFMHNEEQFPEFEASDDESSKEPVERMTLGRIWRDVICNRGFYKLFALLLLTIPAHFAFVLPMVMYPKYWMRVIRPDIELGWIASMNPAIIILGLVLFSPLVKRFNVYNVLVTGMFIGGGSILILAIPPQWIMSVLGFQTIESTYMVMVGAQIMVFAFGEFIWSPQLQVYVSAVTPEGMEGTFLGIARVPYTIAKFVTSSISGFLLASYCPEGVKGQIVAGKLGYWEGPEVMFIILGGICLISPVVIRLLKSVFYVEKEAEQGG